LGKFILLLHIKNTLGRLMSGESSDNIVAEAITESAWKCLNCMAEALNKLFDIIFSFEGLVVKDISISVGRNPTLAKYVQGEKHPHTPSEIATLEVSVKLGLTGLLIQTCWPTWRKALKKPGLKLRLLQAN
jgi:hypothetical protein